jgi:nitrite reductase/ring-hydroxylating ferredoxin subunit
MSQATDSSIRVPDAASLAEGDARTFTFSRAGKSYEGFLLRHRLGFFAYANACPHWNVDLDLGFGDFYDRELDRIFCRNHGALFHPDTGLCSAGPCAGLYLEKFELRWDGPDAVVEIVPLTLIGAENLG